MDKNCTLKHKFTIYSGTFHIQPQHPRLLGITNLINCDFFPVKSGLNFVPTLEVVLNKTLGTWIAIVTDDMTTLDVIAIYGFLDTYLIAM